MALSINQLQNPDGPETYYNPKFCRMFEQYLPQLKSDPSNEIIPVDPHSLYKFEGDLYGLFSSLGIRKEYHWFVMRINSIKDPRDVSSNINFIILPNFSVLDRIRQVFKTNSKKIIG